MNASIRFPAPALLRAALLLSLSLATAAAPIAAARPSGYVFSTFAGRPLLGSTDGPADQASFGRPNGVAVGRDGTLYVADTYNHTIRKIAPNHVVTTLAGLTGVPGSDDGVGTTARFNSPTAIAVDPAGNLFVADFSNHTIRTVAPDGTVRTLAGLAGHASNEDGAGDAARFNYPGGVALARDGTLFVADTGNAEIRKITPAGVVSTLAGQTGHYGSEDGVGSAARFGFPVGIAVDSAGHAYVTDNPNNTIRAIAPDGTVTTLAGLAGTAGSDDGTGSAARFNVPSGIAVDGNGTLYVTDYQNYTVRRITSGGVVTTLAGFPGQSGNIDALGSAARFGGPVRIALDGIGNLYVADADNGTIRLVTPTGSVSTIAGVSGSKGAADGRGDAARFNRPLGVATDAAGNVYVADADNRTIRKIAPDGTASTLAGTAGQFGSADGVGAAARFGNPNGIATDAAGNIYVSDTDNFNIRKIAPDGTVSTLAGQTGFPGSADGIGSGAQFSNPGGLAVDGAGNVYVAELDAATIRKITPAGVVTTFVGEVDDGESIDGPRAVARFARPESVVIDRAGNLFVLDGYTTVRKVTPDGTVSTVVGRAGYQGTVDGPGPDARFLVPTGLAIDALGNLFVSEYNGLIRRIDPAYTVSTVAGKSGVYGSANGRDDAVRFNMPSAIAVDPYGNLYVADTANNTIRQAVSTTRLVNLSVRAPVASGDQTLIAGFVIAGSDPKPVLVRGVGPGLIPLGLTDALADPQFKIYDRTAHVIQTNDNWGGTPELTDVFTRLGAYPLAPDSKDAALYTSLTPGPYTTHVGSTDGGNGIALVEVYDGDSHDGTRLVNASARTVTGGGDNVLIAGLVLGGTAPKTVLIRGVGPSLIPQGVSPSSVLADPRLSLYHNGTVIAGNDDWGGTTALKSASQTVGAFALASDTSKDAAMLVTLDPGVYSVTVAGADATPGVALVEVYEVP